MPEVVQRSWYENTLLFMRQEVQTAAVEHRPIDQALMSQWGQFLRTSKMNPKIRKCIMDGLGHLLEAIPCNEETLIVSASIKAVQGDLRKRRSKKTLSDLPC